jgi:hypothetical protein
MATQATHLRRRPGIGTILVAAGLVIALAILLFQARAILGDQARPAPASSASVTSEQVHLPVFVHPGAHRGQVRLGPLPSMSDPIVRPHGPNQRPKFGA